MLEPRGLFQPLALDPQTHSRVTPTPTLPLGVVHIHTQLCGKSREHKYIYTLKYVSLIIDLPSNFVASSIA
jgi:hypothetical protein